MKFIYVNPPDSGLGDRILDILLLYSYSLFLGCTEFYVNWAYTANFDHSRQCLKLEHLLSYIQFPPNIHFVNNDVITRLSTDFANVVFHDILGAQSIYGFIDKFMKEFEPKHHERIISIYFESFKALKFKNIPKYIVDIFDSQSIATIHLRRTDKVNNSASAHGVNMEELLFLDEKTGEFILEQIANGLRICIVSDDISVKQAYIEKYKGFCEIIHFETGDQVTQVYYDYYCLAHSYKIFMSQMFSTFSITGALVGRTKKMFYVFDYGRIFPYKFDKYPGFFKFVPKSTSLFSVIKEMSKSQLSQDIQVIDFYKKKTNGYFVEIGASDGISFSNTFLLEKIYNWNGICVEPLPNEFKRLKECRTAHCSDRAIYHTSGLNVEFVVKNCSLCSGISETLDESVTIDNVIYKRGPNDDVNSVINVKTLTLNDLLLSFEAPRFIEYLSIDTEGSELEALKSVNFDFFTFGIIDVEHNYVEPRRTQIRELLESYHYVFHSENKFDDHYIHRSQLN